MRDLKNFICRRLDLEALVEDDFAMELLVAGRIAALTLPIQGVYDQVYARV
jgi:E3 ubiquitin-protein ligase UBR4